jgi:hypothetical protein
VDSELLKPPAGGTKILGTGLGHGYAFFSLMARENDYLWGRLDAAERLVRLLLTRTTPDDEIVPGASHPQYRSRCKAVFRAVLAEEAAHLPTISDGLEALREQIEAL